MSLKIIDSDESGRSINAHKIKDGTFFTGRIGEYDTRHFMKVAGVIYSLDEFNGGTNGKMWTGNATVSDFVERNVTMKFV